MKSMIIPWNGHFLGGLLAAALAASGAPAVDTKETARATYSRLKDAVITVTAVVKMEVNGRGGKSQDMEMTGTVIGADGLALVSAMTLNPASAVLDNFDRVGGEERLGSKPKVALSQIKYRLSDGTEVPARVAYQDKDLDLAFLVPDLKEGEKASKFTFVAVKPGTEAKELDDAFCVTRLPRHMSYTPAVMIGQIVSVITKPRTVYDFAITGTPIPGSPVFTSDGGLLGFMLVHRDGGGSGGARELRALLGGASEIVILPTAEVFGLIDQARKAAAKQSDSTGQSGEGAAKEKKDQE
jgi:hypothetical protein